MWWAWLLGGLVLWLLLKWVFRGRPDYSKIFSTEHLIELAEKLERAKKAALAQCHNGTEQSPIKLGEDLAQTVIEGKAGSTSLDARDAAFATSAGLCFFYTIDKAPDESFYEHHLSFSWNGTWFAVNSGTFIAAYIHTILKLDREWPCMLQQSARGIYHFAFQSSPEQLAQFAARGTNVPSRIELPAIYASCWEARKIFKQTMGKVEVDLEETEKLANTGKWEIPESGPFKKD